MLITTVSEFLRAQFKLRQRKNPKYSMRAFARDLKLSSGRLSEIINGVTSISKSRLTEISKNLKLSEEDKKTLNEIYEIETLKEKNAKLEAKLKSLKYQNDEYQKLQEDSFKVISHWYYFAILELTYLKDFKSNIAWIAKRLNISEYDSQIAVDRLIRLKMLNINKKGEYEANEKFTENAKDVPAEVIREHHYQLINKAFNKFAEKFNKEFSGYEENKDSVYSINIQFHRLDSKI